MSSASTFLKGKQSYHLAIEQENLQHIYKGCQGRVERMSFVNQQVTLSLGKR
jgi:hypothetical protein